jgi:hypothetical protein
MCGAEVSQPQTARTVTTGLVHETVAAVDVSPAEGSGFGSAVAQTGLQPSL